MSTQPASSQTTEQPALSWPKRALLIAGSGLGLGIIFDVLFYGKLPGISFPLYVVIAIGVLVILARHLKVKLSTTAWLLMLPLLFFAGMVAVRASGFVAFLNITASVYLLLLLAYVTFRPQLPQFGLRDYAAPVLRVPRQLILHAYAVLSEALGIRTLVRRHEHVPQIVRGVLIAVPILLLFVALFASADLVFRKYVSDIFSFDVNFNVVFHLFWIAVIGGLFTGWLGYMLRGQTGESTPALTERKRWLPRLSGLELGIILGSLNVLFLGFLAVQLTYLFGGEQNVIGQGFTYAQYARKGFFELIAVAVISFGLVLLAEKLLVGEGRARKYFKVLSAVLLGQVLVVMFSAFQRLSLYESAYGFTPLRVYSHIFIVVLAILLGLLLYRIVRNKPLQMFALGAFMTAIAALVFVNVINVDHFVAKQNIARYHATGKIDSPFLQSLSADATPQMIRLLDAKDKHVRTSAAYSLDLLEERLRQHDHWQSANVARSAALKQIEEHSLQIQMLKLNGYPDSFRIY